MAIPAWAAAIIVVQEVLFEPDSAVWDWFGEYAGPGFLAIFAALTLALMTQVALRFVGQGGRVAANLVPLVGWGGTPVVQQGEKHVRAFLPPLRRKSVVGFGTIALLCAAGAMLYFTSASVVPAFRASQGDGGTAVIIGEDVTISRAEEGRWGTTYFLSTAYGEAIAEGEPERGERWIVLRDDGLGNERAYRVGGFAYLWVGGLALLSLLVAGAVVAYAIHGARGELRRRASDSYSDVPLVDSVGALASGHRAVLQVWPRDAQPEALGNHAEFLRDLHAEEDLTEWERRELAELYAEGLEDQDQPADQALTGSVILGLPAYDGRSAGQVLRRRRVIAAGAAGSAVAVVATPIILLSAGVFELPPSNHFITLGYLDPTSWNPEVYASYDNTTNLRDLAARVLADQGRGDPSTIDRAWRVHAESAGAQLGELPVQAALDVVEIGGLSAPDATGDFVEFERELAEDSAPAPAPITDLPPGWRGVVAGGSPEGYDRAATAAGYAGSTLITIRVDEAGSDAELTRRLEELVGAIAKRGIVQFAADTARPD